MLCHVIAYPIPARGSIDWKVDGDCITSSSHWAYKYGLRFCYHVVHAIH